MAEARELKKNAEKNEELHFAAKNGASLKVMKTLLKDNPEGASSLDKASYSA